MKTITRKSKTHGTRRTLVNRSRLRMTFNVRRLISMLLSIVMLMSVVTTIPFTVTASEAVNDDFGEAVIAKPKVESETIFDNELIGKNFENEIAKNPQKQTAKAKSLFETSLSNATSKTFVASAYSSSATIMLNETEYVSLSERYKPTESFTFIPNTSGYHIIESTENGYSDPFVWIYNSDGDLLDYNDDGGSGSNFKLICELNEGQQYLIVAGMYSGEMYADYILKVSRGNTSEEYADPIHLNKNNKVDIVTVNQEQYYTFTPPTTGFYTIESSGLSGTTDPKARLCNSYNYEYLASNNNISSGNKNFRIVYHLDGGEEYYIMTGCYGTGTGNYIFKITQTENLNTTPPTPSTYPAGSTVKSLTTSSTATVAIDEARIKQYFSFTAPAAGTYSFHSFEKGFDPKGWVYNTNGVQLAYNNDISTSDKSFKTTFTMTAGQKVYLVAGISDNNCDEYSVAIRKIKPTLGVFATRTTTGVLANIPNNIGNTFGENPKTTRIITWQTGLTSSNAAETGNVVIPGITLNSNNCSKTTTIADGRTYHRAVITGLTANKTYYYYVGNSISGYSEVYSFKTEPANIGNEGFTILHVTDPQIGQEKYGTEKRDSELWRKTIDKGTKTITPAFIINTGDVTESSSTHSRRLERISHYYDYAQDNLANNAFVYSLGDNDRELTNTGGQNSTVWYNKHFSSSGNVPNSNKPENYSFQYGNALFINIHYNSESKNVTTVDISKNGWLENELKRKNNDDSIDWTVVMIHEAPFGKSTPKNNTEKSLSNLFTIHNVDLVLAGGDHMYIRTKKIETDSNGNITNSNNPISGTVYSIINTAGSKFSTKVSRNDLAACEQPGNQMFSGITFTKTQIKLTAYIVDATGNSQIYQPPGKVAEKNIIIQQK